MATPRERIVDPEITCWYHCISRCVRNTKISDDLKLLIIERIKLLSQVFTIDTVNYGVLDSHMHQFLYLDLERAKDLSCWEVLARWVLIHPPRGTDRRPLANIGQWIAERVNDIPFVEKIRSRLCDLSWYMKELKGWAATKANEILDDEGGVFWSGRFKSIAVLDEPALLATGIYIDLNPFAAGICRLPEEARFSSLRERWDARCHHAAMRSAKLSSTAEDIGPYIEQPHWLLPIEDRREVDGNAARPGLIEGLSFDDYLTVLDETARKRREGKASLGKEADAILQRLGTNVTEWLAIFEALSTGNCNGVYFAFRRESLRAAAARRGCDHVNNWNGSETDVAPQLE